MAKQGNGTKSVSFGKPDTLINPVETAKQEAQARASLTAHVPAASESVKTDFVPTALEAALARLGMKNAREVVGHALTNESQAIITINGETLGKLYIVGKTESNAGESVVTNAGIVGVDSKDYGRMIVAIDSLRVLALAAANVKTRVAGAKRMNGLQSGLWYKPTTDFSQGTINTFVYAEMVDGIGRIDIMVNDSPVSVTVKNADVLALTGKKAANGKARDYVFSDVTYVGNDKPERIVSAWLPGLIAALMARKIAITGDSLAIAAPVLADDAYAVSTDDASTGETETDDATE